MKKNLILTNLVILIAFILTSCGFHLRGQHVLPPRLHLIKLQSGSPYGEFESKLRNTLSKLGVNVIRTGCAPVTLHIINIALFQDVPTIGGSNQARVYVYYYRVTFELLEGNHVLIPPQSVTTSKSLIINPGTALESTGQRAIMMHEMQTETAHMIINFLNAPNLAE